MAEKWPREILADPAILNATTDDPYILNKHKLRADFPLERSERRKHFLKKSAKRIEGREDLRNFPLLLSMVAMPATLMMQFALEELARQGISAVGGDSGCGLL